MFSRLVATRPVFTAGLSKKSISRSNEVAVRLFSAGTKDSAVSTPKDGAVKEKSQLMKTIEHWDSIKEKYNSPERDLVNYPPPQIPEHIPPVRIGFVPQSYFDAFYEKTGVLGPYLIPAMFLLQQMCNERLTDFEFGELGCVIAFSFYYSKAIGKLRSFQLEQSAYNEEHLFTGPVNREKEIMTDRLRLMEERVEQEERYRYAADAMRESLGLQLEAEYRDRVGEVYKDVRRRLDYQVSMENTRRRAVQEEMVDWIVNQVVKDITPQQEQNAISSCLARLKDLTKTHKVSVA